jgi:hypothetical protein
MLWSLAFLVTTELSHGLTKILYSSILAFVPGFIRFRPLLCAFCVTVVRLSIDNCLPGQPRAPPLGVPRIDVANYMVYMVSLRQEGAKDVQYENTKMKHKSKI